MKKRIAIFILLVCTLLSLSACSAVNIPGVALKKNSTFCILFIDVGQGDAALIECDGRYMLLDCGDKSAGDKVYSVLEQKGVQHLDILALSHFHSDHVGGLIKVLSYASRIDKTIANTNQSEEPIFIEVDHQLAINNSRITVPKVGEKYPLGSAEVEVVEVASTEHNNSLVLLITYGENRFLFTGDIEGNAQKNLSDYLANDSRVKNGVLKVDLLKMPHHGAYNDDHGFQSSNLNRLFILLNPDYAVISVGNGNKYKHPHQETIDLLNQAEVQVYQTDLNGDILVRSDGKSLSFETSHE